LLTPYLPLFFDIIRQMNVIIAKVAFTFVSTLVSVAPSAAVKAPINIGYDVSYPQCSKTLPAKQAFGVVGLNDGLANTTNPCLSKQLSWAAKSTGQTSQPKVQLYVNTANPGGLNTSSWPNDNSDPGGVVTDNPYGNCDGSNSLACSYQYGWNRALEDAQQRLPTGASPAGLSTNPADYNWWLDVETINTWQLGQADSSQKNTADLEGMSEYFQSVGGNVGLYSTSAQWGQIVGSPSSTSRLNGLINWRPGARNLNAAKTSCDLPPLTAGGNVSLTQYLANNQDYDYSCKN
jgi:hypothetical protein